MLHARKFIQWQLLIVKTILTLIHDLGSIPGPGRFPGGGHGNPLLYSCLENPMDRGSWQTTVHRVAKSWTQLKQLSTHAQSMITTEGTRYKP